MLEREKQRVAAAARRLASEGLVLGSAGNVSERADELVAVTPTGAVLERVAAEDVVVVDLDDGARIMVQGSSADAEALAIDDVVTLSLRLYARERGIPVYGYKAFRVAESAEQGHGSAVSTGARNGAGGR